MRFLWNVMQPNINTCFATYSLSHILSLSLFRTIYRFAIFETASIFGHADNVFAEFMGFWCVLSVAAAAVVWKWSNLKDSPTAGALLNHLFMFIYFLARSRENFFSYSFEAREIEVSNGRKHAEVDYYRARVNVVNVHLQKQLLLTLFSVCLQLLARL